MWTFTQVHIMKKRLRIIMKSFKPVITFDQY